MSVRTKFCEWWSCYSSVKDCLFGDANLFGIGRSLGPIVSVPVGFLATDFVYFMVHKRLHWQILAIWIELNNIHDSVWGLLVLLFHGFLLVRLACAWIKWRWNHQIGKKWIARAFCNNNNGETRSGIRHQIRCCGGCGVALLFRMSSMLELVWCFPVKWLFTDCASVVVVISLLGCWFRMRWNCGTDK